MKRLLIHRDGKDVSLHFMANWPDMLSAIPDWQRVDTSAQTQQHLQTLSAPTTTADVSQQQKVDWYLLPCFTTTTSKNNELQWKTPHHQSPLEETGWLSQIKEVPNQDVTNVNSFQWKASCPSVANNKNELELEEALRLSCLEYDADTLRRQQQEEDKVKIDPKIEREIAFQTFCTQYRYEVKENYLLKEIAKVLQKINGNRSLCDYLLQQIDNCNWAKNDTALDAEIITEFDVYIKDLTTKCNSHLVYATEDWESFKYCLRHLSGNDIASVRDMVLLKL